MINWKATIYFFWVRFYRPELAIPKMTVASLADIDLEKLKKEGCAGMLIDYDDTLAIPRTNELSFEGITFAKKCVELWGEKAVIFSDWIGTPHDIGDRLAVDVERKLGIKVLKHKKLKPGGIDEVNKYFGSNVGKLTVVGNQLFTDIVFANLNKFNSIWLNTPDAKSYLPRYEKLLMKRWLPDNIKEKK